MTVDQLIADIIEREGGFVNHRNDRGGPTKYGITAATLGAYLKLGRAATVDEVRLLTKPEAAAIYRQRYVVDPGFEALPEPLRAQVVDDGVLSGPGTAIHDLQTALGLVADGKLGPKTRAAIAKADISALCVALVKVRAVRLARVAKRDPSQAVFLEGWMSRALSFL